MNEEPYLKDGDLKPCPFCGGDASPNLGSQGDEPWWYIACDKCAATCESVEEWNMRQPSGPNNGPRWRLVTSNVLPSGVPVQPGTTLYAFYGAPNYSHWEYELPDVPSATPREESK